MVKNNAFNLTSRIVENGTSTYFTYDGTGRRFQKQSGSIIRHIWDGDTLVYDYNVTVNGNFGNIYVHGLYNEGSIRDGMYYANTVNAHGDITSIYGVGASQGAKTYDAYGNVKTDTTTFTNPFGYSGEYTDSETGLQYLRARYYDPSLGRFTQEDT